MRRKERDSYENTGRETEANEQKEKERVKGELCCHGKITVVVVMRITMRATSSVCVHATV